METNANGDRGDQLSGGCDDFLVGWLKANVGFNNVKFRGILWYMYL